MSDGPRDDVVIRTPDRRLRVFVSSTLGELAEERRAVARAITALRLTPFRTRALKSLREYSRFRGMVRECRADHRAV